METLSVRSSGLAAWGPTRDHAQAFVIGSVVGSIDDNFDSSSALELFEMSRCFTRIERKQTVETPCSFTALDWGVPKGTHTLIGGNDSGEVLLIPFECFDKPELVDSATTLAGKMVPIVDVEFSRLARNNFAVAYEDGSVFVYDAERPDSASEFAPRALPRGTQLAAFAWNAKVDRIFSTALTSGAVQIWDLRKKNPAVTLATHFPPTALAWNPAVGTMIATATEGTDGPGTCVWDLRRKNKPLFTLAASPAQAVGVSWNPHDTRFLASASLDGGAVWNVENNVAYNEHRFLRALPAAERVAWSPVEPGLALLSAPTGTTVASYMDPRPEEAGPVGAASLQLDPPAWLPLRRGVTRLVQGVAAGAEQEDGAQTVTVSRVSVCPELFDSATELRELFDEGQDALFERFCDDGASLDPHRWELLRAFATTHTRSAIRALLGFEDAPAAPAAPGGAAEASAGAESLEGDGDLDFFDQSEEASEPSGPAEAPEEASEEAPEEAPAAASVPAVSDDVFSLVLCGNIEECIDRLLGEGNEALALIFASKISAELRDRTEDKILERLSTAPNMPMIALVRAVASEEKLMAFIRDFAAKDWKTAIVAAVTYVSPQKLPGVAHEIARRADSEEAKQIAGLIAGDVADVASLWARRLGDGVDSLLELSALCEVARALFGDFERPQELSRLAVLLNSEGASHLVPRLVAPDLARGHAKPAQPAEPRTAAPDFGASTREISPEAQPVAIPGPAPPAADGSTAPPAPAPAQQPPVAVTVPEPDVAFSPQNPPPLTGEPASTPAVAAPAAPDFKPLHPLQNGAPTPSIYQNPTARSATPPPAEGETPLQELARYATMDASGTSRELVALLGERRYEAQARVAQLQPKIVDLLRAVARNAEFAEFAASVLPTLRARDTASLMQRVQAVQAATSSVRDDVRKHSMTLRLLATLQ
eukprot:gnl/Chilomastix_cuspidata/165.p1 GENE.gnl/Chilomastix_cuspidata/165~~gnl/Chilomastix_cuspidata/165.p1  ORF type:complete len:938 (-),score=494.92 gnl/Chilomastix_cuspidata/165:3026-5839(-)